MNHCREQISKFPKTDAFGIFETIKKSPFLNGNFLLSSPSANASAEIGKFKMKEERAQMKEEKGIILNFELKKVLTFFGQHLRIYLIRSCIIA